MVKFCLWIKAKLVNCTDLQPSDGFESPTFAYYVKLSCNTCQSVTDREVCLSLDYSVPSPVSPKNYVSLSKICDGCGAQGTVTLVPCDGHPLTLSNSLKERGAPLIQLDCCGVEPVTVAFGRGGWSVKTAQGEILQDIDLSAGGFVHAVADDNDGTLFQASIDAVSGVFTVAEPKIKNKMNHPVAAGSGKGKTKGYGRRAGAGAGAGAKNKVV